VGGDMSHAVERGEIFTEFLCADLEEKRPVNKMSG